MASQINQSANGDICSWLLTKMHFKIKVPFHFHLNYSLNILDTMAESSESTG